MLVLYTILMYGEYQTFLQLTLSALTNEVVMSY